MARENAWLIAFGIPDYPGDAPSACSRRAECVEEQGPGDRHLLVSREHALRRQHRDHRETGEVLLIERENVADRMPLHRRH